MTWCIAIFAHYDAPMECLGDHPVDGLVTATKVHRRMALGYAEAPGSARASGAFHDLPVHAELAGAGRELGGVRVIARASVTAARMRSRA